MNFFQLLNSLDELLYELMSWLVFYPLTLWRIVRHPLATMNYAEAQLALAPELQYRGTVSPPVTLILTIVITQGLGLAVDGPSTLIANRHGLAGLIDDNTTLLLLRLVLFGTFALMLGTRRVRRSGAPLDRDTLKPRFYAQCYALSPFVILLTAGFIAVTVPTPWVQAIGVAVLTAAFLFYGFVQVAWYSAELHQSRLRSFLDATIGMLESVAITGGIALAFH